MTPLSGMVILLAALLAAPPAPRHASYRYPTQTQAGVQVWLEVRISDLPGAPGLVSLTLEVHAEGSSALELQPVQVSESSGDWKVAGRSSAWALTDTGASICQSLELRQSKPGLAPVPSVTTRFRQGLSEEWERVEWARVLDEDPDVPPPDGLAQPPTSRRRWEWLLAAIPLSLLLLLLWRLLRSRPAPPPLTPEQQASGQLDLLERRGLPSAAEWAAYHAQLADVLRQYLARRLHVPALEQSSTELLTAVCQQCADPLLADLLRRFLDLCDRAKFAPHPGTTEDLHQALQLARAILQQASHPRSAEASPTPAPESSG